jgi:hypothetical protein
VSTYPSNMLVRKSGRQESIAGRLCSKTVVPSDQWWCNVTLADLGGAIALAPFCSRNSGAI